MNDFDHRQKMCALENKLKRQFKAKLEHHDELVEALGRMTAMYQMAIDQLAKRKCFNMGADEAIKATRAILTKVREV